MDIRKKLAEYTKLIWKRRLTESVGGNMSIRVDDRILITPTFTVKYFLREEDLVEMDLTGKILKGTRKPSSEYRMHLKIYKTCSDVKAVLHAHPLHATLLAIMGEKIPTELLAETALFLKDIAYLPYETPGTQEFADMFEKPLKEGARIFILKNHGVTVAGDDIEEAYAKLEMLEFLCQLICIMGIENARKYRIPPFKVEELLRKKG
ncbi:MAG: class II aldolase/adducin family protein [Thermotogae bacterium]|nr:class II aldolase/adducin family protein [Thermotogota bacterium]